MTELTVDLFAYLKAVFVETWQKVFTLFDVLGIVLFFRPKLADFLIGDESLTRTIGGIIFSCSFLLANFSLYRQITEATSYKADIRLKVIGEKVFAPSNNNTGRTPFREIPGKKKGVDSQGIPAWGYLLTNIEAANIGYEPGKLIWEFDKTKIKLPALFNSDSFKVEFYTPSSIAGRNWYQGSFFFAILFTEQDPHAFAQTLKTLVKSKQQYQVVLRYRTSRVDGESKTRELCIKGDFQNFYQKVLKYWDDYGFSDLADLARGVVSRETSR